MRSTTHSYAQRSAPNARRPEPQRSASPRLRASALKILARTTPSWPSCLRVRQTPGHANFRTLALPNFRTSPSAFTVLELIMVISVLSVLLAIIMPTIKTVREAALRKQAKAGATALAQAAIRYKNEYGFWPGQVTRKDDLSVQLNPMISRPGEWLSLIVCGPKSFTDGLKVNMPSPNLLKLNENEVFQAFCTVGPVSGSQYSLNPLNPKGIEFLQLDSESDFNKVDFPDPWGQAYVLFMGLNPRTLFTYEIKDADGSVIATHSVSNQIAFAFSRGFSGPHQTRCIYSAGVSP